MNSTLLCLETQAVRRVAVALFGAATLAACDSDQPVAPTPRVEPNVAQPVAAQPVKNGGLTGSIVLKLVTGNAAVVNKSGAEYKVIGPAFATFSVKDNDPTLDADPTDGVVLLKGLALGSYKVCETLPPINYGVSAPGCKYTDVFAGATSLLTYLTRPSAHVFWKVVDYVPNYVGGTVFTFKDSTNKLLAQFTDNQSPDIDPGNGWLQMEIPWDGTWTICRLTPPAGYIFAAANQTCTSFTVQQGTATALVNTYVYPIASAVWRVTDGTKDLSDQPVLIGPSTFTVTGGPNSITTTVVDNGPNDMDPTLGKFAAMLPGLGWYSICETVPPAGHWNAKPSCKRVFVASGVPGFGDYFVNPEAQVINP